MFSGLTSLERLLLGENQLASLPAVVFSGLTSLFALDLNNNNLNTLDAGVFSDLTALADLELQDNQLSSLPEELFLGLTALHTLKLEGNSTNPMGLTVTVEKVGTDQVRAKVLAGGAVRGRHSGDGGGRDARRRRDGAQRGGGSVEGEPLTVTRTAGATTAVTVDVDLTTPPTLPSGDNRGHTGYIFTKATTDLPATILPDSAAPTLNVRDAEGNEGDGVAFPVTLSEAATAEVTATWTASIESGDTAVAEDLGSMTTGRCPSRPAPR